MNETNADSEKGSTNPKLEALYKNALLIYERKTAEQKRLQEETAKAGKRSGREQKSNHPFSDPSPTFASYSPTIFQCSTARAAL
jgi:hypothetical protein